MKWPYFLFFLVWLPDLFSGDFYIDKYEKAIGEIRKEWSRSDDLIREFNNRSSARREGDLKLLRDSIESCQKAIWYCEYIIKEINHKPKEDRKGWSAQKEIAKRDITYLNTRINDLQNIIHQVSDAIALYKAQSYYEEGLKRAAIAQAKNQNCPRTLENVQEVVSTLHEISDLYQEALKLTKEAFQQIATHPDQQSRDHLQQAIKLYEIAVAEFRKQAMEWPAFVQAHKETLQEQAQNQEKTVSVI